VVVRLFRIQKVLGSIPSISICLVPIYTRLPVHSVLHRQLYQFWSEFLVCPEIEKAQHLGLCCRLLKVAAKTFKSQILRGARALLVYQSYAK
jgi:hypothetical protein